MTLYDVEKDKEYMITGLYVDPAISRRLQALGMNDGTKVYILNRKKKGALILKVRGSRLALGKYICSKIEVEPHEDILPQKEAQ